MSVDPSPRLDHNVVMSFLERQSRFPVPDPARTRPKPRKHHALHWFAAGAKHLARVTRVVGIGAACIFAGKSHATHAADLLAHAVEQAKEEMKAQADARIIQAQAELQAKLDVAQQQLVEARAELAERVAAMQRDVDRQAQAATHAELLRMKAQVGSAERRLVAAKSEAARLKGKGAAHRRQSQGSY